MAYLELSNPKTHSCDFKVKLSNPFNTDYYIKLRITGTNYGSSTDSLHSYVESRTAKDPSSNSSKYVKGVVNAGLSPGRTVTLYAYAQAKNGTWYLAGSDTITMKSSGKADLRIATITADPNISEFKVGEEVEFKVRIENRGNAESSDYTVKVYDENGNRLDSDDENELEAGDYNNAYLNVTINKSGRQRLKFYISGGESGDRTEYRTYTWGNAGVSISSSCIYCPPNLMKKREYTDTAVISGKRLAEINEWLTIGDDAADFGVTMLIGVGLAAVASGISVTTAPFAVALSYQADKVISAIKNASWTTAVAYAAYKLFYNESDISKDLLESIKNKEVPEIKVSYTFKYVRHGSNDGAYFLTKLDILEA